ncbi:E3 ubiquitin-protein ligase MBR2 [Quillaja saponaria]|uniref:RING-type E3 ubiquitin transferase n=1 Tax=Quillaja saponaria TaxID=32244 RepID=A0AAD7M0L0_QUISA|nr:E3 ubiquitin-protein ligase MBR2 [Quillaja saponaria]
MQGQRRTIGSFPETVNIRQVSSSSSTSMSQQTSLNNMLDPVERRLSDYMVTSGEDTCVSATALDIQSSRSWTTGEPSSRNLHNQVNDDNVEMEREWSSSFSGFRPEERQIESANVLFPGRANISLDGNRFRSEPLFLQGSSSNHITRNENLNMGCLHNSGKGTEAGIAINMCSSGRLETKTPSVDASCGYVGSSSGSSGYMVEEENGGPSSSLGNWGSSCKRKTLEGSSGQLYPGGTSSSLLEAENGAWHTGSAHYNVSSSSSVSTPLQNFPILSRPIHQNARTGVSMRGVASDFFSTTDIAGNAEGPLRVFGQRINSGQPQESIPLNLSSAGSPGHFNLYSPHQIPRPPFSDSLDLRLTAGVASANSSAPRRQSHVMHIPGLSANMHPFPWNGAANPSVSTLSSSPMPGERFTHEESIIRNAPQNNAENPMLVTATDMRSPGQNQTSWHLTSGGVPSNSWIGSSSSMHAVPSPPWIPHHEAPLQNQQRSPEFTSWSLFPSSETVAHNGHLTSLPPGPSASSQDTVMSCGPHSQGHNQPYPRSAPLMERQGDDFTNRHLPLRGLGADIEGRRRLISEIRQVLNAMHRGDNLRAEDYMLFDPFIYHGVAEMHDRHRDMRLDVDNMSYEELLALEERMGDVSTGLSEEMIMKLMKQQVYVSVMTESPPDLEPCCICQEKYADGEDLGSLDCGHDFHTNCIKQWLMQKNLCPICKTTALVT